MDCKQQAQQRCDQIDAFRAELEALEQDGVMSLNAQDKQSIQSYHDNLIERLLHTYDIDASQVDKQLTLGMRIASFLGALAFSASIFFLFYQYWGKISPLVQTVILIASPLLTLGITALAHSTDKSGYFAKIGGLITLMCFVLNLSMLGQIYNITPSPNSFLIWSVLALGLAYKLHSRLLLAFAIMCFAGFLSARMGAWLGMYWLSFGDRPEHFLLPALIIFALGHIKHRHYEGFAPIYRFFAALLFFLSMLVLCYWGESSYLYLSPDMIEGLYQTLGLILSAGIVWYGVKKRWKDTVNTGTVIFTLFLYTKFFVWWWDWFPKYLFFLVIALSALLLLMVFKRLRTAMTLRANGESHV